MGNKTFDSQVEAVVARVIPEGREKTRESIEEIRGAGGDSYGALLRLLRDERQPSELRESVAWLLQRLESRRGVPALMTVLLNGNDDLRVRQECARALGFLDDRRAVPALVKVMQEGADARMRAEAAYGLAWAWNGRDQSTDPLLETVRNRAEDPAVLAQAAEALGQLWEAAEELPDFIEELLTALEDPSAEIRFWTVFTLSKVGDERALAAMGRLADSDDRAVPQWWSVRHEALMGMARLLSRMGRFAEAEAAYRRVLADDLRGVPFLKLDVLEDLARLLKEQQGREAEANELHRQALQMRRGR